MNYSTDPTSRGDEMAEELRRWYEVHRETWWTRRWQTWPCELADEFMLAWMHEHRRIMQAAGIKIIYPPDSRTGR